MALSRVNSESISWHLIAKGGDLTARVHPGMRLGEDQSGELSLQASNPLIVLDVKGDNLLVRTVSGSHRLEIPGRTSTRAVMLSPDATAEISFRNNTFSIDTNFASPGVAADTVTIRLVETARAKRKRSALGPAPAAVHATAGGEPDSAADGGGEGIPTLSDILVTEVRAPRRSSVAVVGRRPRAGTTQAADWRTDSATASGSGPWRSAQLAGYAIVALPLLVSLAYAGVQMRAPAPEAVFQTAPTASEPAPFANTLKLISTPGRAEAGAEEQASSPVETVQTMPEPAAAPEPGQESAPAPGDVAAEQVPAGEPPSAAAPMTALAAEPTSSVAPTTPVAEAPRGDDTAAHAAGVTEPVVSDPPPPELNLASSELLLAVSALLDAGQLPDKTTIDFALQSLKALRVAYPRDASVAASLERLTARLAGEAQRSFDRGDAIMAGRLIEQASSTGVAQEYVGRAMEYFAAPPSGETTQQPGAADDAPAVEAVADAPAVTADVAAVNGGGGAQPELAAAEDAAGADAGAVVAATADDLEQPGPVRSDDPDRAADAGRTEVADAVAAPMLASLERADDTRPDDLLTDRIVLDDSTGETLRRYPISQLQVVRQDAPRYPRAAPTGAYGTVELEIILSETGEVREVEVQGDPPSYFSRAAMRAVRKWQFEPVIENGTPVPVRTSVRVSFRG